MNRTQQIIKFLKFNKANNEIGKNQMNILNKFFYHNDFNNILNPFKGYFFFFFLMPKFNYFNNAEYRNAKY